MFEDGFGGDGEGLSDAEMITRIDALERVKAACAAQQAHLTARFVESQSARARQLRQEAQACSEAGDFDGWVAARDAARALELEPEERDEPGGGRRQSRPSRSARRASLSRTGVTAQVALARHESPSRGARLATAAVALVNDLPHTLAALSAGVLNERRAELVVRGTSHLSPELRGLVDAEVIGANLDLDALDDAPTSELASMGDREVERRVRACADRLDAAAAVKRARIAEGERRVGLRPVPDTMARLTALLPVAQAVAVHAALTRAALAGKAAGDPRGKGQLMADTLVELVTGQTTAQEVPVEVQVVITDRALIQGDDTPAHVPGYGPVPAGWARDLFTRAVTVSAAAGEARARMWFRRLYTHPTTGTLVAMDSARRLFPTGLRRFIVARDGTCRTPWCDAPISHTDHVTPHAKGGATSAANGQGLCVRCNLTKEQPGWSAAVLHPGPHVGQDHPPSACAGADSDVGTPHRVRITTPTGHTYDSAAPPLLPQAPSPFSPATPTHGLLTVAFYHRTDIELELAA